MHWLTPKYYSQCLLCWCFSMAILVVRNSFPHSQKNYYGPTFHLCKSWLFVMLSFSGIWLITLISSIRYLHFNFLLFVLFVQFQTFGTIEWKKLPKGTVFSNCDAGCLKFKIQHIFFLFSFPKLNIKYWKN